MRKVSRSALVPFSANQMFALVEDIDAYPSFLPWCTAARVHSRVSNVIEASLQMQRGGVTKTFKTQNTLRPTDAMDIALLDGPFTHLEGGWRFAAMGDSGCKVQLDLEFEFENHLVDMVFGRFFENTCASMIESFSRRANDIYG